MAPFQKRLVIKNRRGTTSRSPIILILHIYTRKDKEIVMNTHTASNPVCAALYATLTLVFLISASFFATPATRRPKIPSLDTIYH